MKLDFLAIADYVSQTPDGKLTIVGVFDAVLNPKAPAQLATMGIAARFRGETKDADGKPIKVLVKLKDPNNNIMVQIEADLTPPPNLQAADRSRTSLSIPFMAQNLVLPVHGTYTIEIWINQKLEGSTNLYVGPPVQQAPVVAKVG
jgi:hypothetical protein